MIRRRDVWMWLSVLPMMGVALPGADKAGKKQPPQDYTIRTTSRLVLLDVSVKNASGGFVSGLTRDNFKVYEDGKPQEISQFANADIPVTVGIVVDESGSMQPKRAEVIAAALEFIQASNPQDEIFVINFNERARRGLPDMVPFSDNIEMLREALWRGVPEGRTALYDAVEMALHQLDMGRRAKKTMVVISDGGDNVSVHKWPEVMHDVIGSLVTIYTVGIFDEDDPERNPGVLKHLAGVSGGAVYFPSTLKEILPVCRQIAKDIRERYTIGYIPSPEGSPERHIKVVASAPGHNKLIVKTRTNYRFTPDDPAGNGK